MFEEIVIRLPFNAGLSEIENKLEQIPGLGDVTITSNSAKDLVHGLTVSVTHGLDIITPSAEMVNFSVGDWIRIGDRDSGLIYSIFSMDKFEPYSIRLTSAFGGESDSAATVYEHGIIGDRSGYQYIISFDSILGDIKSLSTNGDHLTGSNAGVKITSCDRNVHQTITTHTVEESIDGIFYLIYKGDITPQLSANISAADLKYAIETSITSINAVTVTKEVLHSFGANSWTVRLDSYDGIPEPFHPEGYLLQTNSTGNVSISIVTDVCLVASEGDMLYEAPSHAGRTGHYFVTELIGQGQPVKGHAMYQSDGKYLIKYETPRVGEYAMNVKMATIGGLQAEYYNNRWLLGDPATFRIDSMIDFNWSTANITPTGKDYISARWTGFLKPAFSEQYKFTINVNDGARLWVDGELIFDYFESDEVKDTESFRVYSGKSSEFLYSDYLVEIKLEYRENTGAAMVQLFWESSSQPHQIIPKNRLFSDGDHIQLSPFTVHPIGIEPKAPTDCALAILDWDKLGASWGDPLDDGGEEITNFLIEYWDATDYGVTEIQQIRIRSASIGIFRVKADTDTHILLLTSDTTAMEMEAALESLSSIGNVIVSRSASSDIVDFSVEFLTNTHPVPVLGINPTNVLPSSNDGYCVCEGGQTFCSMGTLNVGCNPNATRKGNVTTAKEEIMKVGSDLLDTPQYSHRIENLLQSSSISVGYGVRVSAGNSLGYGIPCVAQYMKPMTPPDPPSGVEIVRVPGSASAINLHFTAVTSPRDRGSPVDQYIFEWSPSDSFEFGVASATMDASLLTSHRLSTYGGGLGSNNFLRYKIVDLVPGTPYFVRIFAKNQAGVGGATPASEALMPGKSPNILDEQGVTLYSIEADASVSVKESSTSLLLAWHVPSDEHGFSITSYLIEHWTLPGTNEVQELKLASPNGSVKGTFTLSYDEDHTDSLTIDTSASELQIALESLASIRSVHVERTGTNQDYSWMITFLSEVPFASGKKLKVDALTELVDNAGGIPSLEVSVIIPGSMPANYEAIHVPVEDNEQNIFHRTLTDLISGQDYYFQVSALNNAGLGKERISTPPKLAPPKQRPSSPKDVSLLPHSGTSLNIIFFDPLSNGGSMITKYKIEWDALASFNSLNGYPVGSYTKELDMPLNGCSPCSYIISGLQIGKNTYARVYAYNFLGYSVQAGLPEQSYESPKTQAAPPDQILVVPSSPTSLNVSFGHSSDNGGGIVSKYLIEWGKMGYHENMSNLVDTSKSILYAKNAVQVVTSSSDVYNIGGTFRVAFDHHMTSKLSATCTADEMKFALQDLPSVGLVSVSRKAKANGHVWKITFLSQIGHESWFGDLPLLTVSVVDTDVITNFVFDTYGMSGTLLGTNAKLIVENPVRAYNGFEQQSIETFCSSSGSTIDGSFILSFKGKTSAPIDKDVTAQEMKILVEELGTGEVFVSRRKQTNGANSYQWTIVFVEMLGNLSLIYASYDYLSCSDQSAMSQVIISEPVTGFLPELNSPSSGHIVISGDKLHEEVMQYDIAGLEQGESYHVRVAAWNGVGNSFGPTKYSTPVVSVPSGKPEAPANLSLLPHSNTALLVSWTYINDKGKSANAYIIEWDTEPGVSEVQSIYAEGTHGTFRLSFKGFTTSFIPFDASAQSVKFALEGLQSVKHASVSKSGNFEWIITFISNIGDQPLLSLDTTHLGGHRGNGTVFEVSPQINLSPAVLEYF